jgi:hypothetical protein
MTKNVHATKLVYLVSFGLISVIILLGYIWVYQFAPFELFWNTFALNTLTVLSAALAATFGGLVLYYYHPGDLPRRVWLYFGIAALLWCLGEVVWGYYNLTAPDGVVPVPSLADLFWITGYIFFTAALRHQYRIVFQTRPRAELIVICSAWIVTLLLSGLIALIGSDGLITLAGFIDYFYAVADFALGAGAVILAITFQRGVLARPWIGLFAFGVADSAYAWLQMSQMYAWSADNGNWISLAVDTLYIAAYLTLAISILSHWLLLVYGPSRPAAPRPF